VSGPRDIEVEIVRLPGRRAELRHAGQTIRTVRDNGCAEYYASIEEARLRKAAARPRPCLRCQTEIQSEGPHHRMCAPCRRA
jgi:hypothetical protein